MKPIQKSNILHILPYISGSAIYVNYKAIYFTYMYILWKYEDLYISNI